MFFKLMAGLSLMTVMSSPADINYSLYAHVFNRIKPFATALNAVVW